MEGMTIEQINAAINELQHKALEVQAAALPSYNIKIVGFEKGNKESIVEMSGTARMDELFFILQSRKTMVDMLTDGMSPQEARKRASMLERAFVVVDCGPAVVQSKEPPQIAPEDQPEPPPAPRVA